MPVGQLTSWPGDRVSHRVLFICTGNIFRSLAAEYALRAALGTTAGVAVSSAGTDDFPHVVRRAVREYLFTRGLDVTRHVRRTLTADILESATLPVAMSTEHHDFVRVRFSRTVPLFTEACGLAAEPLPDVDEVVPDFESKPAAALAHIRATIDRIIDLTPRLAARIICGELLVP